MLVEKKEKMERFSKKLKDASDILMVISLLINIALAATVSFNPIILWERSPLIGMGFSMSVIFVAGIIFRRWFWHGNQVFDERELLVHKDAALFAFAVLFVVAMILIVIFSRLVIWSSVDKTVLGMLMVVSVVFFGALLLPLSTIYFKWRTRELKETDKN